MPVITVQSLELTESQKKELAEVYISKFSELTHVPKDRIYMFFDGYSTDNVAMGDTLFSEKEKIMARGKFNEKDWNPDYKER